MDFINCLSDFEFELKFHSLVTGATLPRPDFRWEALLWTLGRNTDGYKVADQGSGCFNCEPSEEGYIIKVDRHQLKPGELKIELRAYLPDDEYPDHVREYVIPYLTNIRLVSRDPASFFRPVVSFPLPPTLENWSPAENTGEAESLSREEIDNAIEEA